MRVCPRIVFGEHMCAKIVGRVTPHRVDVIGLVLCIVVLDQETWPLDAVIVPLVTLQAACPGEVDATQPAQVQQRQKPH
jgi:hypothetical protein